MEEKIDIHNLPQHIAIIMDGNGRWAKSKSLERLYGHQEGVRAVRRITEAAAEIGIKYLTLYTFSTENWNRPNQEVEALMTLLVQAIEKETPTLMQNNVRLLAIGDLKALPSSVLERLQSCIAQTACNTGLSLVLALSYSSRVEIRQAVSTIAQRVVDGEIGIDDIDDQMINDSLYTHDIPDPDLMIRTSGEQRVSNFMLWQLAYSEFYFTSLHWPDFNKSELIRAILSYQQRERRFGKTSEQLV